MKMCRQHSIDAFLFPLWRDKKQMTRERLNLILESYDRLQLRTYAVARASRQANQNDLILVAS